MNYLISLTKCAVRVLFVVWLIPLAITCSEETDIQSRTLPQNVKKFVIITIGRSGHSWLVDLLRQHPQIVGLYHEPLTNWWWGKNSSAMREWLERSMGWKKPPHLPVFLPSQLEYFGPRDVVNLVPAHKYKAGMEGDISRHYQKLSNRRYTHYGIGLSTKLSGFPHLSDKKYVTSFFQEHNFSVIFQSRKNIVAGAISEMSFSQFVANSAGSSNISALHISTETFCHHLRERWKRQEHMVNSELHFRRQGSNCLRVWYEDQVDNLPGTLEKIYNFLDIDSPEGSKILTSRHAKWSPIKLTDRIQNFETLFSDVCRDNTSTVCDKLQKPVCLDFFV
mmetsp:Transcript_14420/g.40953  ORF Transcript_14420/g.40953 Transcript_14420/m.40953 type:complete len:335 (-) Transcript_14420:137-1141(-)